jgi:hypothetical protein
MNKIYKSLLILFVFLSSLKVSASHELLSAKSDSVKSYPRHILSLNVLHLAFQNFDWEYHYLSSKTGLGFYFKNSVAFNDNKPEAFTRQRFRLALGIPYTFSRREKYRLYLNPCIEMVNFFYNSQKLDSVPYMANYTGIGPVFQYSVIKKDITKTGYGACFNFNMGGNYFLNNKLVLGSYFGMGLRLNFTPDIVPALSLDPLTVSNEVLSYFYLRIGFQVGFGL